MTKEDLFELMKSDPVNRILQYFGELPDSLKVPEIVEAWITHLNNRPGGAADDAFCQIKELRPDLIDDSVRLLSVRLSATVLNQITPEETSSYKEIALEAIARSSISMNFLSKDFHTIEMLEAIFERCPQQINLSPKYQHWIRPLITPEMKAKLLETNLKFAISLDAKDVSREQWHKLLNENIFDYGELELRKRLDVLVDFLNEGGWPCREGSFSWARADSIPEALMAFENSSGNQPARILYKAKIHTFPIEEVLAATDHRSKIPLLEKIYPEDTLRKGMKHNRALRAHLLENDLGM